MTNAEAKARDAVQLLENPLLNEVLDQIEQAAVNTWLSTKLEDVTSREIAFHAAKAARRVRETIQGVKDNGLIEAARASRAR